MWPFKSKNIKQRKKRIQLKADLINVKMITVQTRYFILENLFGATFHSPCINDGELPVKSKFICLVSCFYHGFQATFFTDHELICNKVDELVEEYKTYQSQLIKLKKFLEIMK